MTPKIASRPHHGRRTGGPRRSRTPRPGLYTLKDVCRLTGAKRSSVEYWVKSGIVLPHSEHRGTGNHRFFSFMNLVELSICRFLNDSGYGLPVLNSARLLLESADPADGTGGRIAGNAPFTLNAHGSIDIDRLKQQIAPQTIEDYQVAQQRRLDAWRAFKNPATRPSTHTHFLAGSFLESADGERAIYWFVYDPHELAQLLEREGSVHVLNLRPIFERLERETGDYWAPREG